MALRVSPAVRKRVRRELRQPPRQPPPPPPTLSQLSAAFVPEKAFLSPAERGKRAATRISQTAQAARRIAKREGITFQAAGQRLREISREIPPKGFRDIVGGRVPPKGLRDILGEGRRRSRKEARRRLKGLFGE